MKPIILKKTVDNLLRVKRTQEEEKQGVISKEASKTYINGLITETSIPWINAGLGVGIAALTFGQSDLIVLSGIALGTAYVATSSLFIDDFKDEHNIRKVQQEKVSNLESGKMYDLPFDSFDGRSEVFNMKMSLLYNKLINQAHLYGIQKMIDKCVEITTKYKDNIKLCQNFLYGKIEKAFTTGILSNFEKSSSVLSYLKEKLNIDKVKNEAEEIKNKDYGENKFYSFFKKNAGLEEENLELVKRILKEKGAKNIDSKEEQSKIIFEMNKEIIKSSYSAIVKQKVQLSFAKTLKEYASNQSNSQLAMKIQDFANLYESTKSSSYEDKEFKRIAVLANKALTQQDFLDKINNTSEVDVLRVLNPNLVSNGKLTLLSYSEAFKVAKKTEINKLLNKENKTFASNYNEANLEVFEIEYDTTHIAELKKTGQTQNKDYDSEILNKFKKKNKK